MYGQGRIGQSITMDLLTAINTICRPTGPAFASWTSPIPMIPKKLGSSTHFRLQPTTVLFFNGAWGVYPYLPSGTIVVSDIEGGLFVLKEPSLTVNTCPPNCPPNGKDGYQYAAKLVCGIQKDPKDLRLTRGRYATTINIVNVSPQDVKFSKTLALTIPPGNQKPGEVKLIADDLLRPDEALKVDCMDIKRRLYPNGFPNPFIEGFVIIESTNTLDVTGVYTSGAMDLEGRSTGVRSIDVEQIHERGGRKNGGGSLPPPKHSDLSIKKSDSPDPVKVNLPLKYTLTVTNHGPEPATNVQVTDTLPTEVIFDRASPSNMCTHNNGTVTCNLGTMANGDSQQISFVVKPIREGIVTNTAIVRGDRPDPNLTNNKVAEKTIIRNANGSDIVIGAPPISGEISTWREKDRYSFVVSERGIYTIETPRQYRCHGHPF